MSERQRANHQYGAVSFLATQWRALIGANPAADDQAKPQTRITHQ